MNIYRILGDSSHMLAIAILFIKICLNRSSQGVSGKSQILFFFVYVSRYLDLATVFISYYNTIFKIMFISITAGTLFLIYVYFRKTREVEDDSFWIIPLLFPAFVLAYNFNYNNNYVEIMWTFSIYLETVALIPQFFLLFNKKKVDHFILHYLLLLGIYRGFYMLNWMYRYQNTGMYDKISSISGTLQTVIFVVLFIALNIKIKRTKKEEKSIISIIGSPDVKGYDPLHSIKNNHYESNICMTNEQAFKNKLGLSLDPKYLIRKQEKDTESKINLLDNFDGRGT